MYFEPPFDVSEATGTERETALADLLGPFVRAARNAFSGNTERAVRSDLAIYAGWCAVRGETALPASAETVAAFVDAMAEHTGAGDGAPLRRQHRRRPPGARMHRDAQEPGRAARAQAHAPLQGAPPGPGDGADLAAAPAPGGGCGRPPERRPQPRPARRRLRHAAPPRRARIPASARSA